MKEFSKEYIERLNTMIEQHDTEAISTELKDMHPADIAELVNDLHDEEALYVMRMLDDETAVTTCSNSSPTRPLPGKWSRWTPTTPWT